MSDIKLFRIAANSAVELKGQSATLEKSLQNLIESHLYIFLGVQFLATEYSTGKTHGGRIDTLGIDENSRPVIIEYKRSVNENVINQGLYYLDWLMDHKAEFKLLVMEKLGHDISAAIEWGNPRLLCIAGDFTKYDEYAVQQINRNIELIRYRRFDNELLLFELVNATSPQVTIDVSKPESKSSKSGLHRSVSVNLENADSDLQDLFHSLKAYLEAMGDDVQLITNKFYFAFKRIKNFACVEVYAKVRKLIVYVKVDPTSIELRDGFTRDVRSIGHYGTGDLEITISNDAELEMAKPLILKSYEAS